MNKKLLVIGFVWPEPKSSAAGSRILQLIDQFQKQGFTVTFASAAKQSENTFNLEQIHVETQAILLNDASFDTFVQTLNPDVFLFDRFMTEEQYGWRIIEHCPEAIRVLDTEDFHGLRKAREQALKKKEAVTFSSLQNEITKREIASIYRCDLSLMISEAEIEILTQQFNIDQSLLCYLPFLLKSISEEQINTLPTFEERAHFVTIGNFLHAPNYDAVLYLKQEIWPLIRRQLPKAELHIYGAYESQKVTQLHKPKDGFYIKGFANEVTSVMKTARVCLAALRFGAGLKGKLVDAMQNGTPCAMTSIAAEGMFGGLDCNGFVEDNPEVFANKAVALYTNPQTWIKQQQNGFAIINERFNDAKFYKLFKQRINSLSLNLEAHRENNFIGQLLRHQSMQSTKYMSKWIEAKNKGN
ncbi:MAG: glycosyltransferase [Winogradskyella arenosi]